MNLTLPYRQAGAAEGGHLASEAKSRPSEHK